MKRLFQGSILAVSAMFLAGCASVVGQWESVSVNPPEAAKEYNLAKATFNSDGTYEATAEIKGEPRTSKGTYRLASGTLKLQPENGEPRQYAAKLCTKGCKLTLSHEHQGQTVTVMMKRFGSKCSKGSKKACGGKKACCSKNSCGGKKKAACKPECTKPCCAKKAKSCTSECTKPCCAKAKAKACAPGCKKSCCVKT